MGNCWGIGVAIYAAIVATGALFLEIRRWVESGPRLYLTVSPNRQLIPSTGGRPDGAPHVVVSVSNRGSEPTTITMLGLRRYDNWFKKLRNRPSEDMFIPLPTIPGTGLGKLPHLLEPGREWHGFMDQDDKMEEWLKAGRFYVAVYSTHSARPTVKRLPRPR